MGELQDQPCPYHDHKQQQQHADIINRERVCFWNMFSGRLTVSKLVLRSSNRHWEVLLFGQIITFSCTVWWKLLYHINISKNHLYVSHDKWWQVILDSVHFEKASLHYLAIVELRQRRYVPCGLWVGDLAYNKLGVCRYIDYLLVSHHPGCHELLIWQRCL